MTNIFKKYATGVYCMQSGNADFQHNDNTIITTKYGKEIAVIIWKKLFTKNDLTYYSVVREDGFCRKEWMQRKAGKRAEQAERAEAKSNKYYEKSNKHRDFLSLAEPIKIGHHSEKRHRKIIDDAYNNMGKSVAESKKAKNLEHKAETLACNAEIQINLDAPESLDLLQERVAYLEKKRDALKASKKYQSFELTNLGANIRRYKERLETAKKLWDLDFDNSKPTEKEIKAKKKQHKQEATDKVLKDNGVIWAFTPEQFEKQKVENAIYVSIGAGGYCPKENIEQLRTQLKAV